MMLSKKDIFLRLKPMLIGCPMTTTKRTDSDISRIAAAVLVIIHYTHMVPYVILTKRSSKLRSHTAEISFPGGRFTKEDLSLRNTAIRETKEEVGLDCKSEDIIGSLPAVRTLTSNFFIVPFVTLQDKISEPKVLADEVERVIDAPLIEVLETMDLDHDHYHLAIDGVYKFTYQNEVIWGATARILKQLYNCLCIKL